MEPRYINLKVNDGTIIPLDYDVAIQTCNKFRNLTEVELLKEPFEINASAEDIRHVVDFLNFKYSSTDLPPNDHIFSDYNANFFTQRDAISIMTIADFLDSDSLIESCAAAIANEIVNSGVDDIRKLLGVTNDFKKEELNRIEEELLILK